MIDASFLSELKKLELALNKRITSKYRGERKSVSMGTGTIFRDHRIYTPGDNYKAIDWKVYARTGDLFIKLYEEERNLDVHILIDTSASMHYNDKFDYASKMALGVAYLAMKNNEKIHFATFADDLEVFRGAKGKGQVSFMLSELNKMRPKGDTNIDKSLSKYRREIKSKSFIVIISDFMTDLSKIFAAINSFGNDQTVKLIQVLDKNEKEMDLQGDFRLIDAEDGVELRTYISNRFRENYKENLQKHVAEIQEVTGKLNFDFYQFSTDQPVFDSFFELVNM